MATLIEKDQVGKREGLADLIANVEVQATPVSSMIAKRSKPNQVVQDWQVKSYPKAGHKGVRDNVDASDFNHTPRKRLRTCSQKIWWNPSVSDFAQESVVAGVPNGEMAAQIADALVVLKRIGEQRILSNEECAEDDGAAVANETRGLFKWNQNAAQTKFPVPDGFRTPLASIYSGALSGVTESQVMTQMASSYKQRKGPGMFHGICGVDLKTTISNFSRYESDKASHTAVRRFTKSVSDKEIVTSIDRLVFDTGTVDLHLSSFIRTDAATGEDTDYTHRSGIFLDMNMCGLAYTRLPRVVRLEYKGGGYKAIVDAIIMLMVDNPLGNVVFNISAD